MAILPAQPHIEVKIVVDGTDAVEYEDKNPLDGMPKSNEKKTVRFIETTSEATYSIRMT